MEELRIWKVQNSDTLAGRRLVFPYRNGIITQGEFADLWEILLDCINGISLSDRIKDGQAIAKKKKTQSQQTKVKRTGRRHKMFHAISFTSHQLRHTYATNCISDGIDVRTVQYLMGHATAQMTMGYTHLSQAALSDTRAKINAHSDIKIEVQKA